MNSKLTISLLVLFTLLVNGFMYSQNSFKQKINNYKDFSSLKGKPTVAKYSDVEAIKVVYDVKKKKTYFINAKKFDLHYQFCHYELKYPNKLSSFNRRNYSDARRRFTLVNLNYFKESKKYIVEFNVVDDIGYANMVECYRAIKKQFINGEELYVSLNNSIRLGFKDNFNKAQIAVLSPNDLFSFQKLQILNKGEENGKFVIINNTKQLLTKNIKDKIVLLTVDVLEMPICRAIITTSFQTPLSHISILAQNRGIPVMAYPKALSDSLLVNLLGKNVCFSISNDNYKVFECKPNKKRNKKKKLRKLKADLNNYKIIKSSMISLKNVDSYGSKVVNFCELTRINNKRYKTPEGAFAIPFSSYKDHVSNALIRDKINKLLKDKKILNDRAKLKKKLKSIRKSIKDQSINNVFLNKVLAKIDTSKNGIRYRFRSSSNAEDIKGFNGAGLYTSKTGIIGDSIKTVEKAIKKVWASVWTLRAFEERTFFNIDHSTVYMGILVHRSFPNDYMNGVAITKNLYRDYKTGFVLNNQIGEHKVVDNEFGNSTEQLISYFNTNSNFFNSKEAIEYIATSNLNDFKPILTPKQIFGLTKELDRIKKHFFYKLDASNYKKFALDIEYKLADDLNGECNLYIKQARLFSTN